MVATSGAIKEVNEPQRAVVDTGHAQARDLASSKMHAEVYSATERNNFGMAVLGQTDKALGGNGKARILAEPEQQSLEVTPIASLLPAQGQPDAAARKQADESIEHMVA